VRLYFPEEAYRADSLQAYLEEKVLPRMKESFPPSWNIRSAFEKIKIDEQGIEYVELKGTTFEKKSDINTDQNISLFVRHGLGKSLKREFRAFALFLALIQDPDVKDDNTKVKLVPSLDENGGHSTRIVFSASDMGIALGLGFPNLYPRDFVKGVRHSPNGALEKIRLKYKAFFQLPIFDALSFSDSRWLMRQIAKIPADKILEVFRYGGYPEPLAQYYSEVFLRRCHQLYDALGMKNGLVDENDNALIFPRESAMKDKHNFAVPGYEQFFKNGVVFDPENELVDSSREHFARDWGTSLRKGSEGRHRDNFYKVMTKGLKLEAGNFVQRAILANFRVSSINMFGGENSLIPAHNGFIGGFSAGMDWFIPMRFVIENPTSDAVNHPYWVIDMFRLVFSVTAGSSAYYYMSGISPGTPFGVGGEVAIGRDVIRIHPTKDYATAHKKANYEQRKADREGGGPTKKYYFENLDHQLLERMKPGDFLVSSTFVGGRGSGVVWMQPLPSIFTIGFQAGTEAYLTKRTYVTRTQNDNFLVSWSNIKRITAYTNGFLRMVLIQIPLIGATYRLQKSNNLVYQFDWNDSEAQKALIDNVNESKATKVPEKYALSSKSIRKRGPSFLANIVGIRSWRASHARTEIQGENFITGEQAHELAYEHRKNFRGLTHWEYIDKRKSYTRAQINEKGEIFAKIDFHYFKNETSKYSFLKTYNKFKALLPPDLIIFDPTAVKEYLGNFDIKALVILGPGALESLFGLSGPTNMQICRAFLDAQHIDKDPEKWCAIALAPNTVSTSKRKIYARSFVDTFARLRNQYRILMGNPPFRLTSSAEKNQAYRVLEELVNLLGKNRHSRRVLDAMLHFVSPEDIFRDVSLHSSLEAFPSLSAKLESSTYSKGKLLPIRRYMLDEAGDAFKIFTDEIDRTLQHLGAFERTAVLF